MGITPDRFPGTSDEEELLLEDRTADGNPTEDGAIRYVGGDIVAKIPSGVVSLTASAGSSLLGRAVFTTDGGLVYSLDGDVQLKVNQ